MLSAVSGKDVTIDNWGAYTTGAPTPHANLVADLDRVAGGGIIIAAGQTRTQQPLFKVVDDSLNEPTEYFLLDILATNAAGVTGIELTIIDDDPVPLVSVADAQAGEGTSLVFVVTLSAASGRDVTVGYSAAGVTAGQTSATISIPTVVDNTDEGDGSETLTLTLSNPANAALGTSTATGTIYDVGLVITPIALDVDENDSADYQVSLATQPTADVTVSVVASSIAGTDVTVAPASRTFTTMNWDTPQTFTVTAADDSADADDPVTIEHATSSTDSDYDQLAAPGVAVTVVDDDTPAVIVSETSLDIAEGASGTYTLVLRTQPTSNVSIRLSTSGPGEHSVTLSDQTINFTPSDWSTAQTVTVTAVQDADKADETLTISHSSNHVVYAELDIDTVSVAVADDDKTAPGPPSNFAVTGGDTEATLGWGPPTDDGGHPITGYQVRVDGGAWAPADSATRHTVTGLTNDQEYEFEVRAQNTLGWGDPAGPVAVTPVELAAPTSFRVVGTTLADGKYTVSDQEVALDWSLPAEAVGQRVTRTWMRPGHSCPDSVDAAPDQCPEMILYEQTGTRNTGFTEVYVVGGTYTYTVRAIDSVGNIGSAANITVVVPELDFTPAAPDAVAAASSRRYRDAAIKVDWEAPAAVASEYLTPAYIVQWRKTNETYNTITDPNANPARAIFNAYSGKWRWGADGQYRFNFARTRATIGGLEFDTDYWIRVGTCATTACVTDDIVFAAEITHRTIPNPFD
ncbi:MAG: fibronectin type III domain-containing protein [bacterium]|nr:fibronectin type III domain-containing protein [bacterium]